MPIYVGIQYSARHNICFDQVPSIKQVNRKSKEWQVTAAYSVQEYAAMLDTVFECTDMQSNANGESIAVALWSVLQYFKEREKWFILVSDQKTISTMLAN